MRKMSSILGMFAMMAMQTENVNFDQKQNNKKDVNKTEPKKIIPNGVKEYYFDCFGNIYTDAQKEYTFKCFARNDKNAIRKFKQFIKK